MELYQVDAFTDRPFAGNPAAICLIDDEPDAPWMQALAQEMNLSETAFVRPVDDGFDLRWFTPGAEVDLCGHATLASAHVLYETGRLDRSEVARFSTRSGILTARPADNGWIELDFPADPVTSVETDARLAAALGVDLVGTYRGKAYHLVEVKDAGSVRAVSPDFRALQALEIEVIVTSPDDSGVYDFISRFFAPGLGVNEDPVTGSAHCTLATFWSERLGQTELVAYQASQRGGVVRIRCAGDRVKLQGRAITVMQATLYDPALRICPRERGQG